VNSSGSHDVYIRKVAACFAGMIVIHVLACIYFTVTPKYYPLHRTAIALLYKRVFLIGPFYTEHRISISPSLYIRYKDSVGEWSPLVDYGSDLHRQYYSAPWRYDKLKQDDLMRHFMREAFNTKWKHSHDPAEVSNTKQFCTLSAFITKELIDKENVDSIHLIYSFSAFSAEQSAFKVDTVWNITFNPKQICDIR
jgi:hypothetical protein